MIPFIDLKAQQEKIRPRIEARIKKVLDHGQYIMGPEIRELEKKLAEFTGAKHAITCSSGTDALLMVLMAWGLGPGDAVFTTPFTFIATAEVISFVGATPVFVDIDPRTFNIDTARLELAIKTIKENDPSIYPIPNTQFTALSPKAIIPVDLFGLPANYDIIMEIAKKHNLLVLADAAQSFGGEFRGRRVGTLGQATATSFFPAKPLGCYGDGGAVFTDDDELADILASIRVHGKGTDKYDNVRIGINARLDTIQAAILLSKLEIFPDELEARQTVAETYSEQLASVHSSKFTIPYIPEGHRSAWAQYSVLSDNREELITQLQEEGIPTSIYYPKPLHLQLAFKYLNYRKGDFEIAESISARIFSLPMHPNLNEKQTQKIGNVISNSTILKK
jgi:UDP-2-acetamido-2-deoxy-ribo-hexuluronate aminotransferase